MFGFCGLLWWLLVAFNAVHVSRIDLVPSKTATPCGCLYTRLCNWVYIYNISPYVYIILNCRGYVEVIVRLCQGQMVRVCQL